MSGQRTETRDISRIKDELSKRLDAVQSSFLEKFNDQMSVMDAFLRDCERQTGKKLPDFLWDLAKSITKNSSKKEKMDLLKWFSRIMKENAELYSRHVPTKSFNVHGTPQDFARFLSIDVDALEEEAKRRGITIVDVEAEVVDATGDSA